MNFFEGLGIKRKKGIFDFVSKFKKPKKDKVDLKLKETKPKAKEVEFSKTEKEELVDEKQLGDQVNEIFPQGMTKEEFNSDKVQGDIYNKIVSGNMLDNLIRKQLTKKGIDAKDPSAKVFNVPIGGQEGKIGFIEDVKFKLYEKSILRFDPEKNDDFGGFIVSELVNYRIGDTWKDARKTSKEIRTPQYGDQDVDFASPTTTDEIINKIDEESYGTPKIELETAFNPEVKDLFQKAKEVAKEKYTPKFTFKNFKGFLIDEAQTVFGIDPKTGTLNATDIQNAQEFIADNWESVFVFMTPEGITPSGTSTGVQKVIQREFYLKDEDRVTQAKTGSAAGLYEQSRTNETIEAGNLIRDKKGIENEISELQDALENPMTPEVEKNSLNKRIKIRKEEILDINKKLKPMKDKVFNFFDISTDPEVSLVDRDGRSTTSSKIKAAVIQFERSMMVEAIKKSDENFESKIFEGQSEIMFSKKAKFTETLGDLQKGLNSEDILYNVVGDIIIELENKKPKNQYQAYKIIDNYAADILSKRNHNKLNRQIFEFSDPDQRITIADYVGGIQKLFKYQQRSLGYSYAVNRLKDSVDSYKNDQDKVDAVKDFLKYVSRSIRTLGINGLTTNEKIFNEIISPILGENKLGFELVKKENKTFIYHNNERLQGFSDITLIKQNPSEMSFMMFNESKEAANALIQILDSTPDIENKIGFLSLISSDQRGLLRKLSQPGFYMEGKPSDLILEHETEVSTIFKKFKDYSEGSINKKQLLDFIDKSKVNIVTKAVDNKLFKNKLKGLNNDARYKGVNIKNKKPFKNQVQEVNIKDLSNSVIKFSQNMSNSEILSLAATMDAVLDLAKNPNTSVKKIRVFDFDDTLAQTKSNVNYVMPDGTKGKLTAEEFAKKGDAMAAKGAQWDFSEFNKVMEGKKGPLFNVAERIQRARGTEDLFVLTARAPEAAPAIKEFLDSVGLNIPIENITGLGNSSPFAKSQWVVEKAAEGYNDFYFADDHIANVEAVQDALDQLTDVKARTQVAVIPSPSIEESTIDKSIDSPTEEGSEGLLDIRFSKKNRDLYEKQLTKRRKDLLPEEIIFNVNQVFKFVDNLDVPQNKKKKFEKLALHYLANGYIILPEDGYKIVMAEKIAKQKKLDPFSYKNPNEIMALAPGKVEDALFNPDEVEVFSNRKEYKDGLVVYDVENSKEGQLATRAAIDANWGRKSNPWCLAARDTDPAPSSIEEAWERQDVFWSENVEYESKKEYYNEREKLESKGAKVYDESRVINGNMVYSAYVEYDKSLPHPDHGVMFDEIKVDDKGVPIYDELQAAYGLWEGYGANKKIAFVDGKLIAFRDGKSDPNWWDRFDKPTKGIPSKRKLKDGFTENGILEKNGDFKVESITKGDEKNGRFIRKNPDGTVIEDIVREDGVPVDGFDLQTLSEGNTMTRYYKGSQLQKIEYDFTPEHTFPTGEKMTEKMNVAGKEIKFKYISRTEVTEYEDGHKTKDSIAVTEGRNLDTGQTFVYREKTGSETPGRLFPKIIWKEYNNEKYLTEYDIRFNELVDAITNSDLSRMEKWFEYNKLKKSIPEKLKTKVVPVDEQGESLKFSMNTRMDLDWKKTEKPGPSWQTEPSIGYRTEFKVDDKTYKINIAKLFESESLGILNEVLSRDDIFEVKGDYYEVDFAYIDEKGLPRTDQTGLAGKQGGKVLSIVTNGVLEFARENKVAGLYFTSQAAKRSRIYKVLSDIFGSELGWGNKMKTDKVMDVKTDNFIVSQDIPVKKVNKERKPVRDVLRVIDKSSQTQTDLKFSKANLDKDFNKIIQESSGIEWYKEFSPVKAKVRGAKKGRYKFFLPPSAEDMLGLVYNTLGKGKVGEAQLDWYKEYLFNPYTRAIENLSKDRANLMKDFKALKKALRVPKNLRKKTDSGFTKEQAVRVYLWNKTGQEIPGISETDLKELVDIINSDETLKAFGDQILEVTKGDGYSKPGKNWLAGTITTDLIDLLNTTKRAKYLQEWQENVDEIYSEKNLNKLEAAYGPKYVEALRNVLARMKSGKNRMAGGNRLSNGVLNYINQGQGAIMFYNMRSALLQTISATNFINWSFNNPYKAGKAFANQPQYWKDFLYLMNSDYLVDRRNGLKINISENEIADAAKTSTNKAKAALNYIIQKGYAPSSFMDSFAIASGGATFYRNRVNDLLSQKDAEGESIYTQEQAEEIAFKEFRDKSELSQQSSDPSKISPQQASDLGRIVLQFANTPMQYARLQKRAFQDLKNRRGNPKEHISKIIYYGVLQNVWFNFLQQAGFALGFVEMSDEEEEEKVFDTINGTLDSLLRGIGLAGVTTSVLKNIVIDVYKRSGEDRPEYQDVWLQLLAFSPAIKSKLGKFRQAAWPFDTKKGREEIFEKGFSLDNPAWRSLAKVIEGASGLPLDRLYQKAENLAAAFDDQTETWQSVAMILGWPEWQLQTEEQKGFSRAKEDPTVYSKRQQIEVLRKHGYTDDQIKELKNEEMRAKEILKVQEETGKFYKPKTTEAEQEIISKYNKYSKEEQQSILKQQGYTDKEIYSFNTEEKRVDAIRKANKKTIKRYKPSSKHVYKAPKVVSREPIIK